MAAHSTFPSTRPTQYSWFESITEISILGSTILDGLGVFGLAANGMCPTLLAETLPPKVGSEPSVGNGPTQ
jgi:hypothetical protein